MSFSLALVIGAAVMALVVAGYAIWQYGPGMRERSVRCPVLKKRAKVLVDQRERAFIAPTLDSKRWTLRIVRS